MGCVDLGPTLDLVQCYLKSLYRNYIRKSLLNEIVPLLFMAL
jgi:hypothetical protein